MAERGLLLDFPSTDELDAQIKAGDPMAVQGETALEGDVVKNTSTWTVDTFAGMGPVVEDPNIVDAEIVNETPKSDVPDVVPVEKKPFIDIKFDGRNVFMPPNVVFIGTSNPAGNYRKWLEGRVRTVISDLGREKNRKGNFSKSYVSAVHFIRTAIFLLQQDALYEKVNLVYTGPKLPRDIGMMDAVQAVLTANRDLILALAPYFAQKKVDVKPVPAAA